MATKTCSIQVPDFGSSPRDRPENLLLQTRASCESSSVSGQPRAQVRFPVRGAGARQRQPTLLFLFDLPSRPTSRLQAVLGEGWGVQASWRLEPKWRQGICILIYTWLSRDSSPQSFVPHATYPKSSQVVENVANGRAPPALFKFPAIPA